MHACFFWETVLIESQKDQRSSWVAENHLFVRFRKNPEFIDWKGRISFWPIPFTCFLLRLSRLTFCLPLENRLLSYSSCAQSVTLCILSTWEATKPPTAGLRGSCFSSQTRSHKSLEKVKWFLFPAWLRTSPTSKVRPGISTCPKASKKALKMPMLKSKARPWQRSRFTSFAISSLFRSP